MNIPKRVVVSLLIVLVVLFLGLLFWPFTVNNIIKPIAMVLWLLVRILVLSIHQRYFWYAAIVLAFLVLLRFLPRLQAESQSDAYPETNTTLIKISYWRGLFIYNGQSAQSDTTLRRQLIQLVASLSALKEGRPNDYRILDALQQGQIELPESIRSLLFPPEPPAAGGPVRKFLRSIRMTITKWIRQWSGREKIEHYKMIDEVLNFMEASLEIKNTNGKNSQNQH